MDREERDRKLAMTAGAAEGAHAVLGALRSDVAVYLEGESFGEELEREVAEMSNRAAQISTDLALLAAANEDIDPHYIRGELHRLANRGAALPDPDADRAHLEAIDQAA